MPEGDVLFSTDPAEEDFPAFAMGEKIDEAGLNVSDNDAPVRDFPGQGGGPGHGFFHRLLGGGNLLFHAAVAVAAALSVDVDGVLLEPAFFFSGVVYFVELLGKPGQHAAGFLEGKVTLVHCGNTIARAGGARRFGSLFAEGENPGPDFYPSSLGRAMKKPQKMTRQMKMRVSMPPGQGEKSITIERMAMGSTIQISHRFNVVMLALPIDSLRWFVAVFCWCRGRDSNPHTDKGSGF